MLQRRLHDPLFWDVLSQIDHRKPVVSHHQRHQVLPDVVDVALHGGQNHRGSTLRRPLFLQQGLQDPDGTLHGFRPRDELRQEIFSLIEQVSHLVDGGHQPVP